MKDEDQQRNKVPWLIPLRRPNFYFPRIVLGKPKIPNWVIYVAVFTSIFYVFSGGVYNLVEDNIPAYGFENGEIELIFNRYKGKGSCYSNLDHQYLVEGIVAGLMVFMGSFGLYILNQATRDPHDIRKAENYQMFGLILIILAFLILSSMMSDKYC